MEITRKKIEEYTSKRDEIQELQQKLENIGKGDSLIGNDVILDYRTGYPRPQPIVGYDFAKEKRLKNRWKQRIDELTKDCVEIELWIENIPDSITRRIFRLCFIDGLSQNKVGGIVHLSQASISEKISNFLKSDKTDKKV